MRDLSHWTNPSRKTARHLLGLLLLAGAVFRFQGLNWDQHHHLHPDERFISMVEEKLQPPSTIRQYFASSSSSLNPYNRGHDSFVYGTLPMLLAKAIGAVLGWKGYDGTYLVGRVLSGLFDLLTVWLVYRIARRFTARGPAIAAAGLLAFCPLGIQLSHFWTVDSFLTTFTTAALLGAVRLAEGRSRLSSDAATGAALGLAAACKVTGLALLLPVGAAILLGAFARRSSRGRSWVRLAGSVVARSVTVIAGAIVAVRIALPYAFLGPNPFSLRLDPRWLADLKRLTAIASSVAGFPPNFQWAGRTILFPLRNVVLWGAGPFFGLAALGSLGWCAVTLWKRRRLPLVPLFLHVVFLIAYHGLTMAKSMRYLYPVYPALAVLAGVFLAELSRRVETGGARQRLARALPAVALAGTFLCALAFTAIYRREHPRIAASRWIYENAAPPPQHFLNETWDDGLPLPLPDHDSGQYAGPQPNVVGPDNAAKVEEMVRALTEADWISITSNRAYGTLTRIPDVFPMTRAYYSALFEGRLGFDWVADFRSYPSLGPVVFPDDRAEEAFSVYDHPRVLLFRKSRSFSPDRTRKILLASMTNLPLTLDEWERLPRSKRHVVASLVPPRGKEVSVATSEPRIPRSETGSLRAALLWYLALMAFGVVAAPVTYRLFSTLADRGYGIAKILGLAGMTYLMALTTRMRLLPNGRLAAWLCVAVFATVATTLLWTRRYEMRRFYRSNARQLLAGEAAFAIGFLLFLTIRALNPEIYWGEKPMDFSILNILVRTRSFPPSDPWFAGAPLGYYTFGQQMVALLTLLTGLPTNFTFNLAFGLLGGATLQIAFSLARNWTGSRTAGWAAAAFTALIGNLSGPREWLINKRPLDWNYFWATSRVIPDTINEYPFWSLLFADLHAHILAMPLLLLFASCALHFVRTFTAPDSSTRARLTAAALLGAVAGVEALTNAWDVPMLSGLLVLVALSAGAGNVSLKTISRAARGFAVAVAAAVLTAAPLWVRGGGAPGYGWSTGGGGRALDVLLVFGLFFFAAFGWWLAAAARRLSDEGVARWRRSAIVVLLALLLAALGMLSADLVCAAGVLFFLAAALATPEDPDRRLALGLLASAFFLVLFPQRAFIYDRMNTFFKLYFAAWILFAISIAVLLFSNASRAGVFARWKPAGRAVFYVLLAVCVFTSATAARGTVDSRLGRPAPSDSRGDPNDFVRFGGPTLDGLRYLAVLRPGEYRAIIWLRRAVKGTPVVLEAQGASYQDFSRISMNTGLPTVLGWEHHVKQRGNSEEEVVIRREAIERIYSSPDANRVEGLLRRYHVGYVYVGWLEKKTYPAQGLRKFDTAKDLLELAYENPEVRIYRVVGGDTEDVIAPAREALPAAPPGAVQKVVETEEKPAFFEAEAGRPAFSGMREPRDAAWDDRGRLWVADFGNSRLRVFDKDGGYLGGWGGRGDATFSMREPCAVSIRGDDLYLADTWNNRVQLFSLAGEWKARATDFFGPRGIAAAPDGTVWITDTGNNRLVFYDSKLEKRETVGKLGADAGEFSGPVGITTDPAGRVYVADVGNHRIQVLDSRGKFLAAWPFPGWKDWVEAHLEADETRVYVTDPGADSVVVFDTRGAVLRRVSAAETSPPLSRPTGVALDRKNGVLYIVNSGKPGVSRIELAFLR
jgi:YYY domain-containing protein